MKIAIIGCGYVGSAVARHFHRHLDTQITATTTTPERVPTLKAIAGEVFVVKGDSPQNLSPVLQDQDTVLLSVAAKGGDYRSNYLHTAQNLVIALRQNSTVQQVIYTSSCGVYGDYKGAVVEEKSPLATSSANNQILADTEQVLLGAASEGRRVCILRLAGIYGPDRELVRIFRRVAGKTLPGEGAEASNWVHLDDIVGAIAWAQTQQLQGIYNVVDDSGLTRREVIEGVLKKHNLPLVTWDSSQPSNRAYNARISNQKLKNSGYELLHPQMMM